MQSPSIAIVILNWNGCDDTVECLSSLRTTTYENYRIVLVDNGSAHGEGKKLQALFPEVHLICNEKNRGFSGGCNDGITWAVDSGFDFIALLNNDCLVEPDWLENLVSGLIQAGADFGMCRMMYHPETDLICSTGDIVLADGTGTVPHALEKYTGRGEVLPIISACGGAAIYSRACLEAVRIKGRYFDELFFAYLEDIDLSIRLHAKSFRGVCAGSAVVYHKESKTAGQRSYFQIYQSEKNRMLVELLNFPLWLIAVSELYYLVRTVTRNLCGLFVKRLPRADRPLPQKNFSPWTVLLQSRRWVLENFGEICRDRRERKAKGLISGRVHRLLTWDLRRLAGIRQ
jgi:GT2 family glycosyltransferase